MSFSNAHQSIQKTVLNYAKTDYLSPFLLSVLTAANRNNRIMARDNGTEPGKLRSLKMTYLPPVCDYDASCATDLCSDDGVVDEPLQANFAINRCTSSRVIKIPIEEMRNFDSVGLSEYYTATLANHLKVARQQLAKQVGALVIANAGTHADGSDFKITNLVNTATGVINPISKFIIEKAFLDAELNAPFVVGGDSVYYATPMQQIGGLNANGQNIAQSPFNNYFYDSLVNQLFGEGENLIAFDPNVFKFVSWNANAGRFSTDDTNFNPQTAFEKKDTYYYGSVVDPITGLLWDLDGVLDTCGKFWKFQFKLNWDIFFMPAETCLPNGVNGIFHFKGCEVAEQVCP